MLILQLFRMEKQKKKEKSRKLTKLIIISMKLVDLLSPPALPVRIAIVAALAVDTD